MAIKNIKKKNVIIKKGKKKWFDIQAPALFGGASLGESYVYDVENLNGKYITANLSTITKNMRKQSANVVFRVFKVEEGKGISEIIGYNMVNAAIKRLVRRGKDKIADSFVCKTSDKKLLRIKPLMITSNHTTNMIRSSCRMNTRKVIKEFIITKNVEEAFDAIINGKLQKIMKETVNKIYPIKTVEIRIAKLEENTKLVVTDKEIELEKVKTRKNSGSDAKKWKEHLEEETENKETSDLDLDIDEDEDLTNEDELVDEEEDLSDEDELVDEDEDLSDEDELISEDEDKAKEE